MWLRSQLCCERWRQAERKLFSVQNGLEEKQAHGSEGEVVGDEQAYPLAGVELAGEDTGGSLHHAEQCGHRDGEEDERKQQLTVAGAQAERGKECSVADECPGAERHYQPEEPRLTNGVQVIEDDEQRR